MKKPTGSRALLVSIRLQGMPNEVDHLLNILEQCPEITIDRASRPYLDRNGSSVRRYIDVELEEVGGDQNA